MAENKVTWRIEEQVAALSENPNSHWKKELNRVSWNNGPIRWDLREWNSDHEKMSKGITLTETEMDVIRRLVLDGRI